jgi:hypothetical protein
MFEILNLKAKNEGTPSNTNTAPISKIARLVVTLAEAIIGSLIIRV